MTTAPSPPTGIRNRSARKSPTGKTPTTGTRSTAPSSGRAQQVAASLKHKNFIGTTVKLKLRWADFTTITRQITLPEPVADETIILESAQKLLKHNWDGRTLIRLIGVGVSGLQPPRKQLSLWDKVDYNKMAQLEAAIHQVRTRYGEGVIHRGPTAEEVTRQGTPMTDIPSRPDNLRDGIGTLKEKSLHAEIIAHLAQPGDQLEALVNRYRIDILRGDLTIEVQTRSLGKMKKKVADLAEDYQISIVYPIHRIKHIHKIDEKGKTISIKRSPKKGKLIEVFNELVNAPDLIAHPNVSLTVLMIEGEEFWLDDGEGSWRRKKWSIVERKLLAILDQHLFAQPTDFLDLLPLSLPPQFTNKQLAENLRISPRLAGKITYTLRKANLIELVGKQGRANLFEII